MNKIYYHPISVQGSAVKCFYLGVWIHKFQSFKPFIFSPKDGETSPIIRCAFITIRWGVVYDQFPALNSKLWAFYLRSTK